MKYQNLNVEEIEEILNYRFLNRELLLRALSHRSLKTAHNERLEYLGDSMLNSAVSFWLYQRQEASEGLLSQQRSRLVCESALEIYAQKIRLKDYILTAGDIPKTVSVIADAFEALCASIFLDSSWDALYNWLIYHYESLFEQILLSQEPKDYKTLLQEATQKLWQTLPQYHLNDQKGQHHQPLFFVSCHVDQWQTLGSGLSKKQAQQEAAAKMLHLLEHQYGVKIS